MAKKKEMSNEELEDIAFNLATHTLDALVKTGVKPYEIVKIVQTIAMNITLDAVGTGPGSRQLLTDLLSGMHKAYLEAWEERVESEKKS